MAVAPELIRRVASHELLFFYNSSQPIVFLRIGGESIANPKEIVYDNIAWQAYKFKAMMVLLEHRFYGESVPSNGSSTKNLRYLTSQQALMDLVTFRQHIIEQYELEDSQWIVVGGSYPGSLSAWARLKYPNLFVGSLASSAPIQAETDFYQYNEVVAQSLGSACSSQIATAIGVVTQLLNTTEGQSQLQHNFSLCYPFYSPEDIALFMSTLANPIKSE